ncbi:MAG: hypothetical protein PUI52_00100, partial [Bacteroidales bacterium]|nr:hypothetical protein [Bacteroidales bacterium]MDY6170231.1 hypothetical protein [Candidatus Cryptobacteroides sp.]
KPSPSSEPWKAAVPRFLFPKFMKTDVPELVHVYGGYPFTLPIVTEPGMSKQCTEALKCKAPRARARYST